MTDDRPSRSFLVSLAAALLKNLALQRHVRDLVTAGARLHGFLLVQRDGTEVACRAGGRPRPSGRSVAPSECPEPAMHSGLWRITDHICLQCLGRVVQSPEDGAYRCSICGSTSPDQVETICMCGARAKEDKDLGYRCMPNPKRSFEFPHEIVAAKVRLGKVVSGGQPALPLRL